MTDAQRAELRRTLTERTQAVTRDRKAANAYLIQEGFVTKRGDVTATYGGKK